MNFRLKLFGKLKFSSATVLVLSFLISTFGQMASASSVSSFEYAGSLLVSVSCSASYCALDREGPNGATVAVASYAPPNTSGYVSVSNLPPGEYIFRLKENGARGGYVVVDTETIVIAGAVTYETSYEYDALGRLKKVVRPGGKSTSYEYDDADNRTSKSISN
ncbi:RHS repeat domain-containing protein [Marinimicrobium agarilyticum]|uniref:RHS repeat domain-containing protein n=1 Tax=Marinimicrobium agarilyticum TaxID=306546 RepID=UPI000A04C160|nr:RHS repeat domain-containing protein [Marinimicrobium agarilyticum]